MKSNGFMGKVLPLLLEIGDNRWEIMEFLLFGGYSFGYLLHFLGELGPSPFEAVYGANDVRVRISRTLIRWCTS